MDLVFASLRRKRLPGLILRPLKPEDFCALETEEIRRRKKKIILIQKVLDEKRY
jgi:hypothetical protein